MISTDHSGALVPDLLGGALPRFPDKLAVDAAEGRLTFAEVSDRAARMAGLLAARGIGAGDRVALLAMNDLEYLEIRVGVQRAGAILVPLNYRLSQAELTAILADADVDLLIVGRGLEALAAPSVLHLGDGSYAAAIADAAPQPVPVGFEPEAICQLAYTSGTTARPKGVMLSNRSVHAGTVAMGHELGSTSDAVFLVCTPLFHVGSEVAFSCTMLGATLVQVPKFDVGAVLEALDRTQATHCQMVPTMIRMVLDAWGDRGVSSLKRILYGAAPMPPALLAEALEVLGCEFVNGYGSTEAMGISFLTPAEHDPRLLASVGRSSMLSRAIVADEDGVEVPPGEIGEVLARGPALMSGYWRNPEATAEALRGGWMHTGDMAYRDAEGYLYLVDRRNDKIVTGGENVFPSEVEHVLMQHPDVCEAAVVGVPHPVWGEAVAAVVVLQDGSALEPDVLLAHCRATLAGYKVPKLLRIDSDALPRTATGKLLRRELRGTWT
jgi:acyl-CoA synthetase (AMP-forming)/AMP-acid ligase II